MTQIEELKNQLASGALDAMQYQRTCGTIFAFRATIELIPEIRQRLNER